MTVALGFSVKLSILSKSLGRGGSSLYAMGNVMNTTMGRYTFVACFIALGFLAGCDGGSTPAPSGTNRPGPKPAIATAPNTTAAQTSPAAVPVAGNQIDLIKLIDATEHSVAGTWSKVDGGLRSGVGRIHRIRPPVRPQGDYRLSVSFKRLKGNDSMNLILPVGGRQIGFVPGGWPHKGGNISALIQYKNEVFKGNPTVRRDFKIITNTLYHVEATVKIKGQQADIDITLDGQPFIGWSGYIGDLSLPLWGQLGNPKAIGLCTGPNTMIHFEKATLELLGSGKATVASTQQPAAGTGGLLDAKSGTNPSKPGVTPPAAATPGWLGGKPGATQIATRDAPVIKLTNQLPRAISRNFGAGMTFQGKALVKGNKYMVKPPRFPAPTVRVDYVQTPAGMIMARIEISHAQIIEMFGDKENHPDRQKQWWLEGKDATRWYPIGFVLTKKNLTIFINITDTAMKQGKDLPLGSMDSKDRLYVYIPVKAGTHLLALKLGLQPPGDVLLALDLKTDAPATATDPAVTEAPKDPGKPGKPVNTHPLYVALRAAKVELASQLKAAQAKVVAAFDLQITSAKVAHQQKVAELDRQINEVAETGDLDAVKKLIARKKALGAADQSPAVKGLIREKQDFVTQGIVPTTPAMQAAHKQAGELTKPGYEAVISAYEALVSFHTKKLEIEKATSVQDEMKAFIAASGETR